MTIRLAFGNFTSSVDSIGSPTSYALLAAICVLFLFLRSISAAAETQKAIGRLFCPTWEGGQATLFRLLPPGESLLIDTGLGWDLTVRDADRIVAAAKESRSIEDRLRLDYALSQRSRRRRSHRLAGAPFPSVRSSTTAKIPT